MIVLALGTKGSGKTRLLRQLIALRLARLKSSSALVHDPHRQWVGGEVYRSATEARAAWQTAGARPRLALIQGDALDMVAQLAYEVGNVALVADELDLGCSAKRWKSGALREIAHYGRHRGVDLFGAFRFTRNVHEDLPSLADVIWLLRHSAKAVYDLRTVSQRFGTEYAAAVQQLRDHQTVVFDESAA